MNYMLMAALAFGICSCDDTIEEAIPQHYDQEAAVTVDDIVLNKTLPEAISLKEIADQGDTINLFQIEEVKNLPANSAVDFVLQFSNSEDFSNYGSLDVTVKDGVAFVLASEWQNQYLNVVGRSPKAKDINIRYEAYMVKNGTSVVRMGGPETYVGSSKVNVTPYPSELVIEENYYLLGTVNGWSVAEAIQFSHTGDPYDNPVFTIKVNITPEQAAEGWWWKIVPESTYKTGDWVSADNASFGVAENGSEASEGKLVARTVDTDCGAGCLKREGKLILTINMEEGTYAFTDAPVELYMTGSNYGWGDANNGGVWLPMTPCYGSDVDYWTIIYLHEGEMFKFAPQAGWGDDFGGQATINDVAGANITVDGTNLVAGKAGWYLLHIVNGTERKLTVLQPNVYLIGDTAGEWNVADSHKFTVPTTEDGVFESPAFANDAQLRMCVSIDGFDWWKTEFIVFDGVITYRGRGGDQDRVNVSAGQKAYLNFAKGTAEIK